jgi:hypothetical protein
MNRTVVISILALAFIGAIYGGIVARPFLLPLLLSMRGVKLGVKKTKYLNSLLPGRAR